MISSMTGFGRAESERDGRVLVAEARTVNHRFLELSLRLPRAFQPHESKLRSLLQEKLSRGKLNLTVSWKGAGENGSILSLDMPRAQSYVEILQEVRQRFGFREPVTLGHLMNLPDVLTWTEPEMDADEAWAFLAEVVGRAVDDLGAMRRTEGEALARDLLARVKTLRKELAAVEERAPLRIGEAKERLRARITELLRGEARVDEERLLLEVSFQAERMDCTEECVRLRSHLDQLETMLQAGGPVGRKLNFLTQEMNRETNTIGSKGSDVTIAEKVIVLKEEIEIIREQIQNIE